MTIYNDPQCKSREVSAQRRTIQFLKQLNPSFHQRWVVLQAKAEIPTLDEAIVTMIHEESRIKLLSNITELLGARLNLIPSTRYQIQAKVKIGNATIVVKWVT